MDGAPVAAQQAIAALAPHLEAQVVAQDGSAGHGHDHPRNGESMGCPRRDGGHGQQGLARKGNSGTLDGHKEQHRQVAIAGQQVRQG
jgi:hypothetical protein